MGKDVKKTRIEYVDVARGCVILLMIIGHTTLPQFISKFIWSFHMPFFFFVSGFMFNAQKYESFKAFFIHECKVLLWPFVVCSLIIFLLALLYAPQWNEYVINIIKNGWGAMPIWFVPVLFFAKLFSFCALNNKGRYSKIILIIFIVVTILIGRYFSFYHIVLPYNLASVFAASGFICLGYLCKPFIKKMINLNLWFLILISVSGFLLAFLSSRFFEVDMCTNLFVPAFPITFFAVCGILSIFSSSKIISDYIGILRKFLCACGRNTFYLMAFTSPIMMGVIAIMGKTINGSFVLSSLTRWLIVSGILVLVIYFLNSYAKWILNFDNTYKKGTHNDR